MTSSPEQLAAAGKLATEYPDVWIHTHLAENMEEVEEIARQFPDSRSYLDVYDAVRLAARTCCVRALPAHGRPGQGKHGRKPGRRGVLSHVESVSRQRPVRFTAMREAGVCCGLGTDVGGGTSLSLLRTASEAYKVLHLQDHALPAMRALYLATLGAAEALDLDDKIGNFEKGKEADFAFSISKGRT